MPVINSAEQRQSENKGKRYTNRTGGATVQYGVYLVDEAQAEAESTTPELGDRHLVAVATAKLGAKAVVAKSAEADNAEVLCVEGGAEGVITTCRVESTTDIAKGDPLKLVNAQNYLVKATLGTDHWNAIAREARAADDAGEIKVLFFSRRQF